MLLMLLFYVGEKGYAIDTEAVVEVIPKIIIKPLLHVPPYILGTITYGGTQVPVIDFPYLTESIRCKDSMHSRVFILSREREGAPPIQIGVLAEKITEAIEFDEEKISHSGVQIKEFPYFDGIIRAGSESIQLIDVNLLIDSMKGIVL